MTVDSGVYTEVEFDTVVAHEIGGVTILIGRVHEGHKLGITLYAAALDEDGLFHRSMQQERGFGATKSTAVAALFNLMG